MASETIQGARLLVVDDKASIRDMLKDALSEHGAHVTAAANGDAAIELLEDHQFDAVITDLKMPGKNGIDVLRAAKAKDVDMAVFVVTAYGTIETAVEAMRLGALDFIAKPFQLEEIEQKVARAVAARREHQPAAGDAKAGEGAVPKPGAKPREDFGRIIVGQSRATLQLLKMVEKIGPSRSSVLIHGPSGVGKELVARAIHDASERHDRPFVALNCAALAPGVLESELFGHEKGAFTGASDARVGRFEKAHTGTLFLDEVGEIDPGIQTKLLRVLQESEIERVGSTQPKKIDVRVIAATNRDLRKAIADGRFREDFFYRLNVFSLNVEPLRKRVEDIAGLVEHFIEKFNKESGKQVEGLEDEVMQLFMAYPWPGNVRELENVMERAIVLTEGARVSLEEIPQEMAHFQETPFIKPAAPMMTAGPLSASGELAEGEAGSRLPDAAGASLVERTDQLESELIYKALQRFRWNKTKTAEHLGIKRTTLQYKIKKYGLE